MFLAYLQSINKQKYTRCAFGIPEMPVLNLFNGREPQFAWAGEYLCGARTQKQWKLWEAGIYASSLSIAIMVSKKRAKFYVYVLTSLYLAQHLISKFLEYMSGYPTPARLASWRVMLRSGTRESFINGLITAAVLNFLLLPPVFVLLFKFSIPQFTYIKKYALKCMDK